MNYEFAKLSNIGPRRANEDAVTVVQFAPQRIALAVADGLGGMGGGSRASTLAIKIFENRAETGISTEIEFLNLARNIHKSILKEQESSNDFSSMATTFTAAVVNGSNLIGVHCGDTRLAVARADGIVRLTEDHSEGMRLLKAGKITKDEYFDYPRKHILDSALGSHKHPQIDSFNFKLNTGDKLIISSDGLHQKIPLRELRSLMVKYSEPSSFIREAEILVDQRSAEDNYSIVALWCL